MSELSVYIERRKRLQFAMRQGIAIIPTAPEVRRNSDAHYDYRYDSHFYYLTGFAEPEAVLVLLGGGKPQSILFCREKNLEREIWDGFRHGPEGAREKLGFDAAFSIGQLEEKLIELMANQPVLYYPVGANPDWDARIIKSREVVKDKARTGIHAPTEIYDVRELLNEMRLIKDSQELDIMRRAAPLEYFTY